MVVCLRGPHAGLRVAMPAAASRCTACCPMLVVAGVVTLISLLCAPRLYTLDAGLTAMWTSGGAIAPLSGRDVANRMGGGAATGQSARDVAKTTISTTASPASAGGAAAVGGGAHARTVKFHLPLYWYDCRRDNSSHTGYADTCGGLSPVPKELASPLKFCSPDGIAYKSHYFYFAHVMLTQRRLLEMTGVVFEATADPAAADVVFCVALGGGELFNSSFFMDPGRRPLVVLIDIADGGTPIVNRKVLADPSTVAVLKTYTWRDRGGPCPPHPTSNGYRHINLLRAFGERGAPGGHIGVEAAGDILRGEHCEEYPPELRRKILISTPLVQTVRSGSAFPKRLAELRPIRERGIDVAFMGKTDYTQFVWAQHVTRHRQALIKHLHAVCAQHGWKCHIVSKSGDKSAYKKTLGNVKLFLSPFGLGEWSLKGEEAILSGAVLVKPGASLLESLIPLYQPGRTCVEARPDGKDLGEVLAGALANLTALEEIQARAHGAARGFVGYRKAAEHPAVLSVWADIASRLLRRPFTRSRV